MYAHPRKWVCIHDRLGPGCLLEFILPEVFFKSLSPAVAGDRASIHPKIHFAFDLTEAKENVKTPNT